VQVGKKIDPHMMEDMDCHLYIAPEWFSETAVKQPPYPTIPWYDAKVWQFVTAYGVDGDAIWNVGALPSEI
jgi:hypothetical protein